MWISRRPDLSVELSNYGPHRFIAQRSAFLFHCPSIQFDKGDVVARSTIHARGIDQRVLLHFIRCFSHCLVARISNAFTVFYSITVTGKQVTSRVGNALPSCCHLTAWMESHLCSFSSYRFPHSGQRL